MVSKSSLVFEGVRSVVKVPEVSAGRPEKAGTVRRIPIRSVPAIAMMTLALVLAWTGCVQASAAASVPPAVRAGTADTDDQVKAAAKFAGPDGTFQVGKILVEHEDGELEWMALVLARKPGGATALVDPDGQVYTEGIDDFRAHNKLLTADDKMLVPRDLAPTEAGDDKFVELSGHTSPDRTAWLIGGIVAAAVVVLGGGGLLIVRVRRARLRSSDAADAVPVADSGGSEPPG